MPITKKEVTHVAELARLALAEEEKDLYTVQLQRILGYVEKISAVNVAGVEPAGISAGGARREDKVCRPISHEDALANAPSSERGCFKVPKIIE